MYIGKVNVSSDWTKLEDLIQSQVDGQSSFSFQTGKTYFLQADAKGDLFGIRLCDSPVEPTEEDAGEYIVTEPGIYEPDSNAYLWVRTRGNSASAKLSVSNLD